MIKPFGLQENELQPFVRGLENEFAGAVFVAVYTDRMESDRFSKLSLEDIGHLLELRVFCEEKELLCRRDYMGEAFCARILDDNCGMAFFDETHLLDQDLTRMESSGTEEEPMTRFYTMGGGSYEVPYSENVSKIRVRTYFAADDGKNGIEYPVDWRAIKIF